ncbi:MAG TPA: DUF2961 domain-containing protein [bacterium]|nr:DUF2961 domain-containing protein [bacterium]
MLENIAILRDGRSKRVSSFDRTGRNKDCLNIGKGEEVVLADIKGSGVIRHIWFTIMAGDNYLRRMVLRAYWDGMEHPSVEAPIGDFFGIGHAQLAPLNTAVFSISSSDFFGPKAGMNCYWPMPFSDGARITVANECDGDVMAFYYYVDYDELDSPPQNMGRFHAWWNRNNPCTPPKQAPKDPDVNLSDKDNYLIADIKGRGHYVGCNLSIHNLYGGWWGEGDDMFMVDGVKWPPDMHGTGSEDYFGHAWGMQVQNAFIYNGVSYHKKGTEPAQINERITVYRFHINDPVLFHKSLRVSIEHGHANDRCDDYCSTAYWYQVLPHKKFPEFPKVEDRLPRPDVNVHVQAVDLPIPIRDGRHRSGMPFAPLDLVPQKGTRSRRSK